VKVFYEFARYLDGKNMEKDLPVNYHLGDILNIKS
jgi:hypothetical protein